MKPRKAMLGLAAAMLLVFAAAQAHARTKFSVVCKTTTGDVFHTGTDGSFCEAVSEDATGKAQAKAKGNHSFSEADVDNHGNAKASANGDTANGQADAFGSCHASGKAIGANSTAFARCETGGFAHATATGGGEADAFDDAPPVCTPGVAGTAKVRSSGGNCGP